VTKPGRKVEISYYLLKGSEDIKDNRLARIVATKAANKVLKYANAEEILKDDLQPGFVKLAWEGGWTLVDVIKKAAEENAALKLVPRWKKAKAARTGLQERAKARVVSMFNPKAPAAEMVGLLIQQLTDERESLTRALVKFEQDLGRREDGTLRFRLEEKKNTEEVKV